jgi:hypothetical protein
MLKASVPARGAFRRTARASNTISVDMAPSSAKAPPGAMGAGGPWRYSRAPSRQALRQVADSAWKPICSSACAASSRASLRSGWA